MSTHENRPFPLLVTYLRPQKFMAALLVLLVLSGISVQLINAQVLRAFLDGAQASRPLPELVRLAALFVALAAVRQLLNLANTYVGELVAWTATNRLRADLALHCLKLDMGFHKVHKPGELIERVDGDVNQLATFFSQLVVRLSANLLLGTGVLVLLWTVDWILGAVVTGIVLGALLIVRRLNTVAVPRVQALREIEATLFGYVEEWLHGTETIRSNQAKPYVMDRLYGLLRERWQRGHASMKVTTALNGVPNTVFSLAYIAVFTVGAWHFFGGHVSIGTLYVSIYYIDLLRDPLWQMTRHIQDLQRATASINRIGDLFAQTPTIRDATSPTVLPATPHGLMVEVDHLSFAYSDDPETPILQEATFTLKPGTVLGLLGRTGSGKTTLTKLLMRFYDPTQGVVRLGDGVTQVDLRSITQSALHRRIGVVTQQVQLFNTTVRNNLTLFDLTVEDEQIRVALAAVGLQNWLDDLPDGLDTHIAAHGSLSAGQAQLLSFGRVFLMNPQLIILDEASSRLDPATEQRIEQALDRLLANRTAVIVAHRLATVHRAHEIMILDQGQIIEHDRRETLLADPTSHFSQLLRIGLAEAFA